MSDFIQIIRRRLCQKQVIVVILASLLAMLISYGVRASPEIQSYFQIKNANTSMLSDLPEKYDTNAASRAISDTINIASSHAFSFYVFMEYGFSIYHFIANFFITIPVLSFFDDRKNGVIQTTALRSGKGAFLAIHALAVTSTSWLLVLVPSVIYWLCTYSFAPMPFPLTQNFLPAYDSLFQSLGQPQKVAWLYLILIIITSFGFALRAFLTFAASLYIRRKAILLFIPIAFLYTTTMLFQLFGIPEYSMLSYFDPNIKSVSPILCSYLLTLIVSCCLLAKPDCKERALNG